MAEKKNKKNFEDLSDKTSQIAYGINSGAYCTEIFRAGIQGVDSGQMEAGRSLGLNYWQTLTMIIFP